MKFLFLFFFCVISVFGNDGLLSKLSLLGLPAKVSVAVRDSNGAVVPGADVSFAFCLNSQADPNLYNTVTDQDGIASAENRTNSRIVINVKKDGYYDSCHKYSVWKGVGGYETGRWEPWNERINMVLYEKRSPQKGVYRALSFAHLHPETMYAFDFLKGVLVSISDSAEKPDMYFVSHGSYYNKDTTLRDDWEAYDSFNFTHLDDGVIKKPKNVQSSFRFQYEAPKYGYESSVEYISIQKERHLTDINKYPQQTDEYLIFRITRSTKENEDVYYYGIIESLNMGKDWRTGEISFFITYRINPEPNDRNIEYYQ